jgi:aspartyl aminopeptidase
MDQAAFNRGLCDFLGRATTPFHAVAELARRLREAGFSALDPGSEWTLEPGAGYFTTQNDSSLIAFTVGSESGPEQGMRMVGAHTDSPCLMVKPHPERCKQGYDQLGVEVYGGALLNPWFDRDLSLAGRVSLKRGDGSLGTTLVDLRDPIAVIPSLAIHLDREANNQRKVNAQTDMPPLLGLAGDASNPFDLRRWLAEWLRERGEDCSAVLDLELSFYDTQPAAVIGRDGDFIASARLDNLLSCYTGLEALLASDRRQSCLLVCNDHEEVGSMSAVGAQGPMLQNVLRRLAPTPAGQDRLIAASMLISADNAHGVHPNYPDRHDDNHGPRLNAGPVIKRNASQRYATGSDTAGLFRLLAEAEGVPIQTFVMRADMACGSTIGPITAAEIGVATLDVGVPTFGMHSIRELAGSADAWSLCRILRRFYDHAGSLRPV